MNTKGFPTDLIRLGEASALLPGRKPGKRMSVRALRRWIERGKLRHWYVGRDLLVSRSDVLACVVPGREREKPPQACSARHAESRAWLEARGLA